MVQMKYFGDDRDYFKYDLITFLMQTLPVEGYAFIPMLTEPRVSGEGNVLPGGRHWRSEALHQYISSCETKSLRHWQDWLAQFTQSYSTIDPVDTILFTHATRERYWTTFSEQLGAEKSLVFFDPDTGLQAGRKTKILLKDQHKYVLDSDIAAIVDTFNDSSVWMFYQHLQRNAHQRAQDISRKSFTLIKKLKADISVYAEDDLAFIFVSRDLTAELRTLLETYKAKGLPHNSKGLLHSYNHTQRMS